MMIIIKDWWWIRITLDPTSIHHRCPVKPAHVNIIRYTNFVIILRLCKRVEKENWALGSREWEPRASRETNPIWELVAGGIMVSTVKGEIEWWRWRSGAWVSWGGLYSAALAGTARWDRNKLTDCREISFGFGSAKFASCRIICTRGLFGSIKSAKPHPRFLARVSDLSCITSPWSLSDASKTDLWSGAIWVAAAGFFLGSHFSVERSSCFYFY